MDNNLAIKTLNLNKQFGNFYAVKNINIEINFGEIFSLLGPNGAGKTTTIKLLTGLLQPTAGEIFICGYNIQKEPNKSKKLIGLLPDNAFVYPKLTGIEYLRFVGDVYNVDISKQKKRIPELLSMFDLTSHANELVEVYSQGMRQKLLIASILLHEPKILFLDEPFYGLDPKMAKLVKDIFVELSKRGTTIFMCTHILEIAEKLAHRIGIINKGELIAVEDKNCLREKMKGTLEDIYLELTGGVQYAELIKYL